MVFGCGKCGGVGKVGFCVSVYFIFKCCILKESYFFCFVIVGKRCDKNIEFVNKIVEV